MDALLEPLFPLVLIAQAIWPVLLVACAVLAVAALLLPGGGGAVGAVRVVLAAMALGTALPLLLFGLLVAREEWDSRRQRAAEAAVTSRLDAPAVVDGIALPAGVALRWDSPARQRLTGVAFPRPRDPAGGPDGESTATALGLAGVYFLYRQGDDHWQVGIERGQEIDGWPCAPPHVFVTAAGRLRSCDLSRPVSWQGWTLPPGAEVAPGDDGLALVLRGRGMAAPHGIGALPSRVSMRADGTLASAHYPREAPLRVPGGPALWGLVHFNGAAPGRPPVSVTGADPDDPHSDGWRGPRRTVPWPAPR